MVPVAVDAHGEEVLVDDLAELLAGEGRTDGHLVAVAVEDVDVRIRLPGCRCDGLAVLRQPVGGLLTDDLDIGQFFEAGLETAGAPVREDAVDAEQDVDLAGRLGRGRTVLAGDEVAGRGRQLLGAAPLIRSR